jgi:hypothetical protein
LENFQGGFSKSEMRGRVRWSRRDQLALPNCAKRLDCGRLQRRFLACTEAIHFPNAARSHESAAEAGAVQTLREFHGVISI